MKTERSIDQVKVTLGRSLGFGTLVWLTAVFLGPLLLLFADMIIDLDLLSLGDNPREVLDQLANFFKAYLALILFGGYFSIPNWIIFSALIAILGRLRMSMLNRKVLIQFFAIALTVGLFSFLGLVDSQDEFSFLLVIVYSMSLSLGIWIIPLKQESVAL